MSGSRIDEKYLKEFFGIEDTPEGEKEIQEIKQKLKIETVKLLK